MEQFKFDDDVKNRRQTEYAVVIYLPDNLDKIAQQFRERYDPVYKQVSAHLTIVFPFQTSKSIADMSDMLQEVASNFNPLTVELETIGDFYPRSPVIYWNIKENQNLTELYYQLYSKFGLALPHKIYKPHVTLAREISPHRVEHVKDAIASYLPNETFFATAIDLVTPLANFKWVSVRTFPFKIV